MKVWWLLATPQQKIAASTVLLMASLCIIDYKNDIDMPHLHVEEPVTPMGSAMISSSNTTSVFTYSLLDWNSGP